MPQPGLDYYLPARIPPEVKCFEQDVVQLAVGTSGKLGALRVKFRRGEEKTVIEDLFSKIPFQALRALYLDEGNPGMAFLFIMTPTGGVIQGDRLRIDIEVEKNAMVHITTQSATKIYKMNRNYATQVLNIKVNEGGYLEFIPDSVIPYQNSRFYQEIEIRVHDDASLIYSEIVYPGRVARGETFQYDVYYSKITARNQKDRLRFVDTVVLQPKKANLRTKGLLDTHDFLGNMYVITKKADVTALSEEIHNMLQKDFSDCSGSSCLLPDEGGLVIRVLGDSSITVKRSLRSSWSLAREAIIGVPAVNIRKY